MIAHRALRPTYFVLVKSYSRFTNWPAVVSPLCKYGSLDIRAIVAPTASLISRLYATEGNGYTVKHDSQLKNFYIDLKDKGRAFLEYEEENGKITLLHTEIPDKLQGLGLGKIIAKEALEYVARNNLKLKIECEFMEHYVRKYEPKYLQYTRDG